MPFLPFSDTYKIDSEMLTDSFPSYLKEPIGEWITRLLRFHSLIDSTRRIDIISKRFRLNLQLDFKRTFSPTYSSFLAEVSADADILCNFLSYLLQNYAQKDRADELEDILRKGSSAYAVVALTPDPAPYLYEQWQLGYRVPEIVKYEAEEALTANALLKQAWIECYQRDPNPSLAVSKSVDFLEGFLRDRYWPEKAKTPKLVWMVEQFQKNADMLAFKGDTFLEDRTKLISLLIGTSRIRDEHTTGGGRAANADEGIFVLHTVIYIWNLMR